MCRPQWKIRCASCLSVIIYLLSDCIIRISASASAFPSYQPTTYILSTPVQHPNGTITNETLYYQPSESVGTYQTGSHYQQPTGSYNPYHYYSSAAAAPSVSSLAQKNPHDLATTYSSYSYATQPAPASMWRMKNKRHPSGYHRDYNSNHNHKYKLLNKLYRLNQLNYQNEMNLKKKGKKRNKAAIMKNGKLNPSKWNINRQDSDYDSDTDNDDLDFDYPDFLFSGLDMADLEDDDDEMMFGGGDGDDPFAEETFQRPSVIGLNNGFNMAATGINAGLAEAFPGLGFGTGLKRFFGAGPAFFPRFFLKKFGLGVKIFIAIMLLPLVLLFLPIPILNPNNTTNSRNKDQLGEEQTPQANPILDYGRRVLKSENCIERISCEIHNFEQVTGLPTDNYVFSQFMTFVNNFDGLFPTILGRIARGYKTRDFTNPDSTCTRFECNSLKSHLTS